MTVQMMNQVIFRFGFYISILPICEAVVGGCNRWSLPTSLQYSANQLSSQCSKSECLRSSTVQCRITARCDRFEWVQRYDINQTLFTCCSSVSVQLSPFIRHYIVSNNTVIDLHGYIDRDDMQFGEIIKHVSVKRTGDLSLRVARFQCARGNSRHQRAVKNIFDVCDDEWEVSVLDDSDKRRKRLVDGSDTNGRRRKRRALNKPSWAKRIKSSTRSRNRDSLAECGITIHKLPSF